MQSSSALLRPSSRSRRVSTAQPPAEPAAEPLVLVNANLVNVRDGRITPNATIVIRNGRIESIGSGAAAGRRARRSI